VSIKGIKPFTSWCVEHAQYLLIAVCVAMTITETLFFPPAGVVTFFLVAAHVLAIILISRQPIVCCNIIFLTFAICCLIPDDGGPSFLWGTWLALGYVGLRIESLWGMFYPSAVALVRIWRFDADGVAVNEYFMLILVMFFAYFVGKTFAWKELAAQLKQNKLRYEKLSQHVEYLRKESVVASRIHDSVAGNLAYMAILLDGLILDAEKNKTFDEKEIREVRALVVETLDEMRSVVDLMNGGKTESADNMSLSGLQIVGEQGDSFLKELGFHGKTRIALKDLKNLDDAFSREVFSLIHELYTNIAVHGSPGGEYRLIVFWDDDDLIHVDQVNDISSKNLFPDKPVSGNGLSLHMKWIKSIGGFAKTSSEKGAWQFHARFPVIMSEDSAEPV
jgi:signal transduction histidine kinase